MQGPPLVAEVALELTEDRGRREARELVATAGLEAFDRAEQPQRGNLDQIVDRFVGVAVAERQLTGEGKEALRQSLTGLEVAFMVVGGEELLIGALIGARLYSCQRQS